MKIHEKIQYLLKKKGRGSQKELAEVLGETTTYLNKWVKGARPVPREHLLNTALHLGVTVDYLLDDMQDIPQDRHIPLIGNSSCEAPKKLSFVVPVRYIASLPDINISTSYAIVAIEESMSPTIDKDDIVICDISKPLSNNSIIHYTYENKSGIKRIKRQHDGSAILFPDNKEHAPIIITNPNQNLIAARCIRVIKNIEP